MSLSWTQPICDVCWKRPPIHQPDEPVHTPTRLLQPEEERCAFCGDMTTSGIYVRRNPMDVPFPAKKGE